jgi:hypothetical protein
LVDVVAMYLAGLPIATLLEFRVLERCRWVLFGPKEVWSSVQARLITEREAADKLLAEIESWAYAETKTPYKGSPDVARAELAAREIRTALFHFD